MTCDNCKIVYCPAGSLEKIVELCAKHALVDELAEQLRSAIKRLIGCMTVNGTAKEFADSAVVHERAALARYDAAKREKP